MAGSFRYTVWDPYMIVSQVRVYYFIWLSMIHSSDHAYFWAKIVTLQCAYYVSLGLWIFLFDLFGGASRSLDHFFKYEVIMFGIRIFLEPFELKFFIFILETGPADNVTSRKTPCCSFCFQCSYLVKK